MALTPETENTYALFHKLMAQLHKDNEVLSGLLQAYQSNVTHLIALAEALHVMVAKETISDQKENTPDPSPE